MYFCILIKNNKKYIFVKEVIKKISFNYFPLKYNFLENMNLAFIPFSQKAVREVVSN